MGLEYRIQKNAQTTLSHTHPNTCHLNWNTFAEFFRFALSLCCQNTWHDHTVIKMVAATNSQKKQQKHRTHTQITKVCAPHENPVDLLELLNHWFDVASKKGREAGVKRSRFWSSGVKKKTKLSLLSYYSILRICHRVEVSAKRTHDDFQNGK